MLAIGSRKFEECKISATVTYYSEKSLFFIIQKQNAFNTIRNCSDNDDNYHHIETNHLWKNWHNCREE